MEKLIILRIFLFFPFVGFSLPDAGMFLSRTPTSIPVVHLLIEALLATFIVLCSLWIAILKKRENDTHGTDEKFGF
jgi:hypothetical protein